MKKILILGIMALGIVACKGGGGDVGGGSSSNGGNDSVEWDFQLTGNPEIKDLPDACVSHSASNLEQQECQQIGGTYIVTPPTYYCSISTDETNCLNNNGNWYQAKKCVDVQESDCQSNGGLWSSNKTCKISNVEFDRIGSFSDETKADSICTKYGQIIEAKSCTMASSLNCNAAGGSWENAGPASCLITNQNDCVNAQGEWKAANSSTIEACYNFDVTTQGNCEIANGTWKQNRKTLVLSNILYPFVSNGIVAFSGKGEVNFLFNEYNTPLGVITPTAQSIVSTPSLDLKLRDFYSVSEYAWIHSSNPTLVQGLRGGDFNLLNYVIQIPYSMDSHVFNDFDFTFELKSNIEI